MLGQWSRLFDRDMVNRMLKRKRLGMQRDPAATKVIGLWAEFDFRSVERVTDDGVVSRTGLQANLVSPTSMKLDLQQGHRLAINFKSLFDDKI